MHRALGAGVAVAFALLAASPALAAETQDPAQSAAAAERPRADELDLEGLMGEFAKVRTIRAAFVETKELALLDAPLESRGTILILPPDRLRRETRAPTPATLVIDGDRLRFEDALGSEEVDLAAQPEARQFVDQMLAVLSGDLGALRERYELDYRAEGDRWRLELAPRTFPMKHLIESIALEGNGPELLAMTIRESDGDVTRNRFSETVLNAEVAAEERQRLFGDGTEER